MITELPRAAGATQQKEFVLAGEFAVLPFFIQGANVAHEGRDARHRADQEMVGTPAPGVERKSSLGDLAHEKFVAQLQLVELRCEVAVGYEFEEKLQFALMGRRYDGIGTFPALLRSFHTQGGVLPRGELEFTTGIDANHPEVGCQINPPRNSWAIELVVGGVHKLPT